MGPDLHIHSTASDGSFTPEAIVEHAVRLGIPVIALADHDTIAGVNRAIAAADGTNVSVIPAVELSTELNGRALHILGYWVNHTDPILNRRLEEQRSRRLERAIEMIEALKGQGIKSFCMSDVLNAADGASIGRVHVAQAMVKSGEVSSVTEAFERFLGETCPCFVRKIVPKPEEAITWIREAGGLPVLAHPALNAVDDLIPYLVDIGLAGIEAYHAECPSEDRKRYVEIAAKYRLIVTGGSDFHGNSRPLNRMGAACVPGKVLDDLNAIRTSAGGNA